MAEWKQYNGSDDQIAEIVACKTDVLCRYRNGVERLKSSMFVGDWKNKYLTQYLICAPHPLREMIKQQADTGQKVWVKQDMYQPVYGNYIESYCDGVNFIFKTTTPDWNIPNAQYSFAPFD